MINGKVVAVWGNSGSGKTTTSLKLALKLADEKKNVIVIFTDIIAPDAKIINPFEKDLSSIGNLWTTPNCSKEQIYKALITTKSKYICFLGYKHGENIFSHSDYTKENILDVFMKIKTMADYVIIDCVSQFAYDTISTVALEISDTVICLGEATPKAFSFFDSNLDLLLDSRFKREEHIRVLSKIKSYQARDIMLNRIGNVNIEIPYTDEIEMQMLEGKLLDTGVSKYYKNYDLAISRLVNMFNTNVEDTKEKSVSSTKEKEKSPGKIKLLKIKKEKR